MDIDTILYKIYCFFSSPSNPKYWAKRRKYLIRQYDKKALSISELFPIVKKIRVDYEQEYHNHCYGSGLGTRTPFHTNRNEYGKFERTTIITSGFFEMGNYTYHVALGRNEYADEKRDDFFFCHINCTNPTCIGDGFYLDEIITKAIKSNKTSDEGELRCKAADNHYKDEECGCLLRYKITIEYHTDK